MYITDTKNRPMDSRKSYLGILTRTLTAPDISKHITLYITWAARNKTGIGLDLLVLLIIGPGPYECQGLDQTFD